MGIVHHGTPGGSLDRSGVAKYGAAARAGAEFEREVANAFDQWLGKRKELVHVFHDLRRLPIGAANGSQRDLGMTNIDHLMVTGGGWILVDAKCVSPGQLRIEDGHGVLLTPTGQRRPEEWLDHANHHALLGAAVKLTRSRVGAMVWVLPDAVDYSTHPSMLHPPCLTNKNGSKFSDGYLMSLAELAAGELEAVRELSPPYSRTDSQDLARLATHIN